MKTFEVWYEDGNRRLFEARTFEDLMLFLLQNADTEDIYKIAER